jgi:peptide chain release factor 1
MPIDERMTRRLEEARDRIRDIDETLMDPATASDPQKLKTLGIERSEVFPIVEVGTTLEAALKELTEAKELASGSEDAEMRALASEEVTRLESETTLLTEELRNRMVPKDPLEHRAAVVEIRAGTGGDEAGLFAGDLLRMYRRLAENNNWKIELISFSEGISGSVKEAIFLVRGRGAYGKLRYESGVHRVQRVPDTESQGRIHTSAATVAVLPEAEEVDLQIDPNELRVDVYRSSGPGGQSVNTTDSAVRITHLPSGLVVTCQDEKSQLKNKNKAMKVLRSRLLDMKVAEQEAERSRERKTQVGTGDRSAKIRTYNFPQNRITDHRIGLTLYKLPEVLDGNLDEVITALRIAQEAELMEADDS